MKNIKLILCIAFVAIASTNCKAQDYGTLNYWGKNIQLDRGFFEILNNNFSTFINNTAPTWKYYDYKDYQDIYIKVVDNLKSSRFTIIVTEANQLQWNNAVSIVPGTAGEQGRSKKSTARAGWILYQVLLPSLQQFARTKS
jgi:hypothetical protein